MSRQNLSRSDVRYLGRCVYGPYQGDKPGIEMSSFYRWIPVAGATPGTAQRAATLASAPAAGATSVTLNASWSGITGLYPITFSDGEVLNGLLINGQTTVNLFSNTFPRTGGAYGAAQLANAVTTAVTIANQPPAVGASNSIATSQSVGAGANATINGSIAVSGVGVSDVPRNVVAAWTGTSILTVTGTDYYGQPQTEVSASGTSFTGKKAFATVTQLTFSAAVTLATVGQGNVLGLPFKTKSGGISAMMFNDAADAGTFVPADQGSVLASPGISTSATGDVRGTYALAGTLNSYKYLAVQLHVDDDTTQLGAFGLTPA